MSISPVSSNSTAFAYAAENPFQQSRTDFQDLGKALQAGDLAGAQKAFAAFQSDFQSAQDARPSQSASPTTSLSSDLDALRSALQSNNLDAAQNAFATLTKDLQRVGHSHHHRHHPAAQSVEPTAQTTANSSANSDPNATPESAANAINIQA
jgi:hypothetical protein